MVSGSSEPLHMKVGTQRDLDNDNSGEGAEERHHARKVKGIKVLQDMIISGRFYEPDAMQTK